MRLFETVLPWQNAIWAIPASTLIAFFGSRTRELPMSLVDTLFYVIRSILTVSVVLTVQHFIVAKVKLGFVRALLLYLVVIALVVLLTSLSGGIKQRWDFAVGEYFISQIPIVGSFICCYMLSLRTPNSLASNLTKSPSETPERNQYFIQE
jgi:uncharacterized membrane protein